MRFQKFIVSPVAAALSFGLVGAAIAAPAELATSQGAWVISQTTPAKAATGSGSGGTVEGRVEGSTNSNAMGEPTQTGKTKPMKKKSSSSTGEVGTGGSAGKAEGRVSGSTNSNAKGEPAKVP